MISTLRHLRDQHRADELAAVALRSITANAALHFERGRGYDADRLLPVYAPHLQLTPGRDTLISYRAVADSMAMRVSLSDPSLHARNVPSAAVERFLFDWLEQLRVESIAPDSLPGLRRNLRSRYESWSREFLDSGSTESSLGILLYAFSQIVWSRLTAQELPEGVQDLLEPTRAALAPALGSAFAGIRRYRDDQSRFAPYALEIVRDIAARIQSEYDDSPQTRSARRGAFALSLDLDQDDTESGTVVQSGDSPLFIADGCRYRIYTNRYDQERYAADLIRPALLQEYRERLDRQLARQGVNVARLSRALRSILARPRSDAWRFGQETGLIDGRRLAQLVSSPGERRVFRDDQITFQANAAVTLLVDCSGSMKAHAGSLALIADVLMRALEQAGIGTEIAGFTTSTWNGGRARLDWLAHGRPPGPGRLNEACHLVFKRAGTPWRQARRPVAALLRTELFREGLDGEAVEWACQRLLARAQERRILIVISDGCPMDSSTNLANDPFYLDNHLKSVVMRYTQQAVEIIGVGVGLDLSPYYARSIVADLSEGVQNSLFDELLQRLASRRP